MDDLLIQVLNEVQHEFGSEDTGDLRKHVEDIIPLEIDQYKIVDVTGNLEKFKAVIKCNFHNENDIVNFIENYKVRNNETLRIRGDYSKNSKTYSSMKYYRCHHNTRYNKTMDSSSILIANPYKRFKNTDCPFSLVIKTAAQPDGDYNTSIVVEWSHNHSVTSLHALSFKDMPDEVVGKIKHYFNSGLLPGAAYKELLKQLHSECKDDLEYHRKLADRSIIPRRMNFNSLYGQFTREKFGTGSLKQMYEQLDERIGELMKNADYTLKYQKFDAEIDAPFILVIITPLMKRVHALVPNAKDLMFIDSSSNMEEFNLRVFILVTHSVVGALPLCIFITSDEQKSTLVDAFALVKDALPGNAFFGSTSDVGPAVIMTDNCDELRDALSLAWPRSVLLLCTFHILQQVWRWLHDKKNCVELQYRPQLLNMFKQILYAEEADELDDLLDSFLTDDIVMTYPNFIKYVKNVCADKEGWALCYRKDLMIRGNQTNNFCEAQFLVIKDEVLSRQKEVNVVGLFDKLTNELDAHYKNKLLQCASGKYDGVYPRRYKAYGGKTNTYHLPSKQQQDLLIDGLQDLGQNTFVVPSMTDSSKSYMVDMNSGMCQCHVGSDGAPCKHQYTIWARRIVTVSANFVPVNDPQQRKQLANIAIGSSMPEEFYEGLHDRVSGITNSPDPRNCSSLSSSSIVTCDTTEQRLPRDKRRERPDMISKEEAEIAIKCSMDIMLEVVNENNQDLMRGFLKFHNRLQTMKSIPSNITSALHCFGSSSTSSTRMTATSIIKKSRRGKIFVQPEAIKRRSKKCGSKNKVCKGQLRQDPFVLKAGKPKRPHMLAENVKANEPPPKKAGRSMATKTRVYERNIAKTE